MIINQITKNMQNNAYPEIFSKEQFSGNRKVKRLQIKNLKRNRKINSH